MRQKISSTKQLWKNIRNYPIKEKNEKKRIIAGIGSTPTRKEAGVLSV